MGRVKNAASTTAGAIGKAFSGLGGLFAGGALVAGLTTILRKMDDVSDMARRFGTTAVEIQKVGNAAEIVGTNVDAVARAMNRAGVSANKAAREGGSLADAFARVDIDPAKFAAAGLEDRIKMVAQAQRAANGDAQKMADLFEVIGIRAAGINFAELVVEMEQVSAASNETVEALAAANDQLDKLKQGATVFGANLIKGVTDAGERLGSFLAGQGFKTVDQINQEQNLENAKARLKSRGELLPDDSKTITRQQFVGGAVPATVTDKVLGPNAEENLRRINSEMEKMRSEAEAASRAMDDLSEEAGEAPAKVEKTSDQIDQATKKLERQAQLLEDSNEKRKRAYNTEVALTEARLSGNKALEESILQQEDFNQVLEETGSFETASSVTNTRALERARQTNEVAASPAMRQSDGAPTTNERIAAMRGEANAAAANAAAERFQSAGQFRSAVRAQDRAKRRMDKAMENARVKDILGGINIGEAYEEHRDKMGLNSMSREDFEASVRAQAKTPEQRAREQEEAKQKSGKQVNEGGRSSDPVADILKLLTERLPIHVLAA